MRVGVGARLVPVALGLGLGAGGCGARSGEDGRPVVAIGDRTFDHQDFDDFVALRTGLATRVDPVLLSSLLDDFVREHLLLRAAEDAGTPISDMQIAAELAVLDRQPGSDAVESGDRPDAAGGLPRSAVRTQVRNRLLVQRFLDTRLLADLDPDEDALRLEYDSARPFYAAPETVSLSERAFERRADADAAREALGGDPGSDEGFDPVGTFRRGELPERLDQALFALEPGEYSEVLEAGGRFRVFRVDERSAGGPLSFEEAEEVVRLTVLRREADARVAGLVEDLRERHPVRVFTERLRFPYVGVLIPLSP